MKSKIYSFLVGVMIFIAGAGITMMHGCNKADSDADSGVADWGYLQFYQATDLGYGQLKVYINGDYAGEFSAVDPDGPNSTDCSINGFSKKFTAGSYSWKIQNASASATWSGTTTVPKAGMCKAVQLLGGGNTGGGGGGGGGGTIGKAEAMFYTAASTLGVINVKISGLNGQITQYYSGAPSCGAAGCATFDLGEGTHTWSATNGTLSWNGTVTVKSGSCSKMNLTANGGGGGGSTTGNLIVWTNADQGGGPISVTVNGQFGSITTFYGSNTQTNFPACGSGGCANFTLNPGTYTVQASDGDGNSWSGSTVTVSAGNCSSMMLQ